MSHSGRLAQLARASRLHREGRGFEPLIAHHWLKLSFRKESLAKKASMKNSRKARFPTIFDLMRRVILPRF